MILDMSKVNSVFILKVFFFFEGSHPIVYCQLFIILVPSIHNVCKDQMY